MKILEKTHFEQFQQIEEKLNHMLEIKTVDLSILPDFEVLKADFTKIQAYWEANKEKNMEKTFILYHYARNAAIIIEKVITSFKLAKQMNRNPEVAYNTLDLMPALLSAYEDLITLEMTQFDDPEFFDEFS